MPVNLPSSAPETPIHNKFTLSRLILCALLFSCNPQKPAPVEPDKISQKSVPERPQIQDPDMDKAKKTEEFQNPYTDHVAEDESPPPSREQYKPENICYVGDSYMIAIADEGSIEQNVFAREGRPFVSDSERWDGHDIKIYAKKALDNGQCHLLILNGGLNDLYSYYKDLEETFDRVRKAYEEVLSYAREMNVPVIVLSIPKIPKISIKSGKDKKKLKIQEEINAYTDQLNDFIGDQKGVMLVDSDSLIKGRFKKDGVHPTRKAFRDFLKAL